VVRQALARRATQPPDAKLPQNVVSPEEVKSKSGKAVEVEGQTIRLVRAAAITVIALGLWAIWLPSIPALSALDRFTIWDDSTFETESLTILPGNGVAEGSTAEPTVPSEPSEAEESSRVSVQDLVGALITLLLTIVAARNVPGLLELTVFQRMRLKPGGSFAFTTTIRYFIIVVGFTIGLGMIDVTWGKLQWIAAAITLGIGFGLQEIFANFVAGLIILFERPIRLGDVVTVGDVSGKISQIRMRATTIRQFNNRELIVPNKEFITGKLVNWTLSDSVLRLEIPVGIAYGSDTGKAREILLEVAAENRSVLADPAPDVLFDSFGDSALGFQLRAHVGCVEDLVPVTNDLHFEIDRRFREAGIEIAFPQTDLHIRSMLAEAVSPSPVPASSE
jgi:potassium efflux system protein